MLDLLIIIPSGREQIFQSLAADYAAIEPPTWALLVANYLRMRGWKVGLLDLETVSLKSDDISLSSTRTVLVHVHGSQPSASTQNMPAAIKFCRALKTIYPTLPLFISGSHPAALPNLTLEETGADVVIAGEGYTELDRLLSANPPSTSIIRDPNIDPALIPLAAWDLIEHDKYRAHTWHSFTNNLDRSHYGAIYTSTSCPFRCNFCAIHAPYGGPGQGYRLLPVARVVDEIRILVEQYGVKNLKIIDEMFLLNRVHVAEICRAIIKNKWALNIWAYSRIDTCRDTELLKLCKEAGINWLALGIESADESVRDGVDKSFTNDRIYENCARVRDAGINIVGNFIVGLPDDTYESMETTFQMAVNLLPEWMNIYPAVAYPGSKLYTEAKASGQALPDSWLGYSMHSHETFPLGSKHLTPAEVLRFRDAAFVRYYSSDMYQSMVERKFGTQVKAHIQEMLTHKLKRKILGD